MILMQNIKTGEKILVKDKRELKHFLKYKYPTATTKNIVSLIGRKKPYRETWLISDTKNGLIKGE